MKPLLRLCIRCLLVWSANVTPAKESAPLGPYDRQVEENMAKLADPAPAVRAHAAEALGFLRAYRAEASLAARLADPAREVRRQAALSLAWCGGRASLAPLLERLDDPEWLTRQAAHVALCNVTGLELPFNSLAPDSERQQQAQAWRAWWRQVPADRPPPEVLALLAGSDSTESLPEGSALGSTGYQPVPSGNLPDGTAAASENHPGASFVATPAAIPVGRLPTGAGRLPAPPIFQTSSLAWRRERGVRALGALGGQGATAAIIALLGPAPPVTVESRPMVRAGLRAVGRLREEVGRDYLIRLLQNPMWARHAAEALGDVGDRRAVGPLLAAYARFAKRLDDTNPREVPADDTMSFPSEDRMLETPYWIAYALCRLPLDDPRERQTLRRLAPQIMANLPGDHDAMMLYQPESGHWLTRHLLEQAGVRQEAAEQAFVRLGQARRVPNPAPELIWSDFDARRISPWLPCVCLEPEDLPRLLALLQHTNGWVRINAAKAMAWLGDSRAITPIAKILAAAKAEGDYGYSRLFKDDEFDDPSPRWREALVRALGLLKATQHVALITRILDDERSVLEVRHAAAEALADIGNREALAVLQRTAREHPFGTVRQVARDALWIRRVDLDERKEELELGNTAPFDASTGKPSSTAGELSDTTPLDLLPLPARNEWGEERGEGFSPMKTALLSPTLSSLCRDERAKIQARSSVSFLNSSAVQPGPPGVFDAKFDALLFIKGDNNLPNSLRTVEQADRWRQTYVVTDEGPSYRPGDNFYVLRPPRSDGVVTPLTQFKGGYVGEPEISWDGRQVIFTRCEQDSLWWHLWRVNTDGSRLEQLTHGPYHDVGPAYLPDGRVVFASSRTGIRDEYHGYACTALYVMNADGSDMHPIATNIGRDNEPALLSDGRIAFTRLEVFYSRNKTELTLHAAFPDGTHDTVLYGPERRQFWRQLNHGPPGPDDGQEAPLTHRVLRMTQPQPMLDGRIVVSTQGGLTLVGSQRDAEELISPDYKTRAYTTPVSLSDGTLLCAATLKTPDRERVDLALYRLDPRSGRVELIYNDPTTADYEPRPILARRPPPVLANSARRQAYSGRFFCASVFNTLDPEVVRRGRLVRLVEGVPVVGRHSTHNAPTPVWQNHGGTFARVLGTAPLAPDGSFHIELPADRLVHLQVLDSDRRVVGNQLTWIYARPGETKSCAGCHENPQTAPAAQQNPLALRAGPLAFLPTGREFTYRAKAWFKGSLPAEVEERTRTVHSVSLLAR